MNAFSSGVRSLVEKINPSSCSIKSHGGFSSNASRESISEYFSLCLESCSDIISLRKLHPCILTYGLGNSSLVGSKLLTCYAKFNLLTESRQVFDAIVDDELLLWNSTFVGYFRTDHFHEVLRLYSKLKNRKVGINSASLSYSLKSCIDLGNLDYGRGVHVDTFKFGFNAEPFMGSTLIKFYSRCGDIEDAHKVFEEIIHKDIVVYTSIIAAYSQISGNRCYKAFTIVDQMQKKQLDPNRVTLVSLLQAATQLKSLKEGRSIHGFAIRKGMSDLDEIFETTLVDMYGKCGAPKTAASAFGNKKMRSVLCWNALISGYLQNGQHFDALDLFRLMLQEHIFPDLITVASGISGCANLKCLLEGKSIHGYVIRGGIYLDLVATTALIDMYCKCNKLVQARQLFDAIRTKDIISSNVMMAGYLRNGFASEALEIFSKISKAGIGPTQATILSLLAASSNLKDFNQGKELHGYVLRNGFESKTDIENQIIDMYAKCGCLEISRNVFNRVKHKDLVSYTTMMMGYVSHGHADDAIALYLSMHGKINPDSVTLTCLLQATSQLGCLSLAKEIHSHIYRVFMETDIVITNCLITTYAKCGKLSMARDLFDKMIRQCRESWNAIIAAYGMHGNISEALKLFDEMKEERINPDETTFTSILSACSHSGLVDEGIRAFISMTEEYSITPCEDHYNCVVDLLSRVGRIEEAYDFVKRFPSSQSVSALNALLSGCRIHRFAEIGEVTGRMLLDLKPEASSSYASLCNLYAGSGKWNQAIEIRTMGEEIGFKRTPGYSLIEALS